MPRTAVIGAALVLLLPFLGGCAHRVPGQAASAPAIAWPKTPCRASVEAFLSMGGLSLAQMERVEVREDRLAGGQPGDAVGSWYLTGRPESCPTGGMAMTILPNCAVHSWETTGGCRIAGLEVSR